MSDSGTEFDYMLMKMLINKYVVTGFKYSVVRGDEFGCIYSELYLSGGPFQSLHLREIGFDMYGGSLVAYIIYEDMDINKRYYIDYTKHDYLVDLLYNNVLCSGGITNKKHIEFINKIKLHLI